MKNFENMAQKMLNKSLSPVPHELNDLDWKVNISSNKKRLANHISAFANYAGGGILAYGIDDKTGNVIGVDKAAADEIVKKLANIARDGLDPVVQIKHSIIEYRGKPVLVVQVKESAIKPVHLRNATIEDSFIRSGGTTRKASRHEIGALMLNSKTLRWEELNASKLFPATKALTCLDYQSIGGLLGKPLPDDPDELLNWLENEKMVKSVNDSGYYITNFGAIAAAVDLNDFDDIKRKALRIIRYKGLNKTETEKEFPDQKGYAIGFNALIQMLKIVLPSSEVIKEALRMETTMYPIKALRELIANALIHQDFTVRGAGPMVEIFDNRIEITSPGKLLPTQKIDRLIGAVPESRNEILASAFRRYNICEERGSGLAKAVTEIELFGLPPLYFEEGENYFRVIMYSPKSFAELSVRERIDACYQHAVIKHISRSSLTNTSLRKRLKMNEKQRPMVSRIIKDAVKNGYIKARNIENKSSKFAEYIPYWA